MLLQLLPRNVPVLLAKQRLLRQLLVLAKILPALRVLTVVLVEEGVDHGSFVSDDRLLD